VDEEFIIASTGVSGGNSDTKSVWREWLGINDDETIYSNNFSTATLNADMFNIEYNKPWGNTEPKVQLKIQPGENATYTSGAVKLYGGTGENTLEFTITAVNVKGNDTAKASWQNWLDITPYTAGEHVNIENNII
jgi:asparagine N-glycosylation enzyme membrane subunit Stt3